MKIPDKIIAALERREATEISQWLSQAYLNWALDQLPDPFHPYPFFSGFRESPAEAIELLYTESSEKVRDAIHHGIEKIGRLCGVKCPESQRLSPQRRKEMLEEFCRLSSLTICFRGAATLAKVAIDDDEFWEREFSRDYMFGLCLAATEDLATRFEDSVFAPRNEEYRPLIEESLRRFAFSRRFESMQAPRLLYALVCLSPGGLLRHLELLGQYFVDMHDESPEEEQRAYFTAQRIVDKALDPLITIFPDLKIASRESRDSWLISALFDNRGPLRLSSLQDPDTAIVFSRKQPKARFSLVNPELRRNGIFAELHQRRPDELGEFEKRPARTDNVTYLPTKEKKK